VRDIDEKRKISFPRAEVINGLKIKPTINNIIIIQRAPKRVYDQKKSFLKFCLEK